MPTDRRALREAWEIERLRHVDQYPNAQEIEPDELVLAERAYRAGQADRLEECITAVRQAAQQDDDWAPGHLAPSVWTEAVLARLEALKGGSR